MRHHASLRRLPRVECLEVRDNPSNAFGNFFSGLVGRVEVLTHYGVGAVKGAFEHGPSVHAQHMKQHRLAAQASVIATVPVAIAPSSGASPATVHAAATVFDRVGARR